MTKYFRCSTIYLTVQPTIRFPMQSQRCNGVDETILWPNLFPLDATNALRHHAVHNGRRGFFSHLIETNSSTACGPFRRNSNAFRNDIVVHLSALGASGGHIPKRIAVMDDVACARPFSSDGIQCFHWVGHRCARIHTHKHAQRVLRSTNADGKSANHRWPNRQSIRKQFPCQEWQPKGAPRHTTTATLRAVNEGVQWARKAN